MDPADYVLQDFSPNEQIALTNLLERAVEAGLTLISEGIDVAMDKFNGQALG
jgi:peptidyl-tRNA hydrolase